MNKSIERAAKALHDEECDDGSDCHRWSCADDSVYASRGYRERHRDYYRNLALIALSAGRADHDE